MIKQWMDLVLEHNWAYGQNGNALSGKKMFQAISAGGPQAAYTPDGFNQHTIAQFLLPFQRTAALCKMTYLPPFVAHATHRSTNEEKATIAKSYQQLMLRVAGGELDTESLQPTAYLNDIIPSTPNS